MQEVAEPEIVERVEGRGRVQTERVLTKMRSGVVESRNWKWQERGRGAKDN